MTPMIACFPKQTGELFPHNPLNRHRALRFTKDEQDSTGAYKLHVKQASVCAKKIYTEKSLKPGICTVYCQHCNILVGFSLLDEAERLQTIYDIFSHRDWVDDLPEDPSSDTLEPEDTDPIDAVYVDEGHDSDCDETHKDTTVPQDVSDSEFSETAQEELWDI